MLTLDAESLLPDMNKHLKAPLKKLNKLRGEELEEEEPEKEELDWWSKYYASLEEQEKQVGLRFYPF